MPKTAKNDHRHKRLLLRQLADTIKMPWLMHSVMLTHCGSTPLSHAVTTTSHRGETSPLIFRHPAIMLPVTPADNWL
jgi:hypothetical protein